jgi:hypothetical protein
MVGNAIPNATIAKPHLISLRCKLLVRLSVKLLSDVFHINAG